MGTEPTKLNAQLLWTTEIEKEDTDCRATIVFIEALGGLLRYIHCGRAFEANCG